MDDFELKHESGKLIAIVSVDGIAYEKDITDYMEKDDALDDWLDFRLGI